jgi:starch phosphorylase
LSDTDKALQIPSLQVVDFKLPSELQRLHDIAYNLWWTWSFEARDLLSSIERSTWTRYRNPIELLLNIDPTHWETLIRDDSFMARYSEVVRTFDEYMAPKGDTWFHRSYADSQSGLIAYFSMEYGLHSSLAILSAGLL